jgi:uncharacterized damage-inducible protein DinB
MVKEVLPDLLKQNIQSCGYAFREVRAENSGYRLTETAASVGFLYRHIGETMLMFGTFFGLEPGVQNTTMGRQDEGQGERIEESRALIEKGYAMLQQVIDTTEEGDWQSPIETPFFGTVSKARLFAHVLYHNSYHAGQIALTLKRASK